MRRTFCLLTPPGRSAVATTLVCGEQIRAAISTRFFNPAGQPVTMALNRPTFGYWSGNASGKEGLVVCLLDEQTAEIHSHGGNLAPQMIGDSLVQDGFQKLSPQQYLQHTNSDWLAQFHFALTQAPTKKTAIQLLRLFQTTPKRLNQLKTKILDDPDQATSEIQQALRFASFGIHLCQPWRVVICGQPNVGKSSLINAISGFTRAIVHDTPGTTRDVVSQATAIDGWPIQLTDTAGIRNTSDDIESQGVKRALAEAQSADLRIALFDSTQQWNAGDSQILQTLQPDLLVHNKADRVSEDAQRPDGLFISATQQTGLGELMSAIVASLIPHQPTINQWLPINEIQCEKLRQILALIADRQLANAAAILP